VHRVRLAAQPLLPAAARGTGARTGPAAPVTVATAPPAPPRRPAAIPPAARAQSGAQGMGDLVDFHCCLACSAYQASAACAVGRLRSGARQGERQRRARQRRHSAPRPPALLCRCRPRCPRNRRPSSSGFRNVDVQHPADARPADHRDEGTCRRSSCVKSGSADTNVTLDGSALHPWRGNAWKPWGLALP